VSACTSAIHRQARERVPTFAPASGSTFAQLSSTDTTMPSNSFAVSRKSAIDRRAVARAGAFVQIGALWRSLQPPPSYPDARRRASRRARPAGDAQVVADASRTSHERGR
jgi:hypothetical protein